MNNELIQETQKAFSVLNPVLWAITSQNKTGQGGLIATFVTDASIVPEYPRFLVGIAKHHQTAKLIEDSQACALHLFSQQYVDWVWKLGTCTGKEVEDKLETFKQTTWQTKAPILLDAISAFDCQVEATFDSGDRFLFLLNVVEAHQLNLGIPIKFSELWNCASDQEKEILNQQLETDQKIDHQAIQQWQKKRQQR